MQIMHRYRNKNTLLTRFDILKQIISSIKRKKMLPQKKTEIWCNSSSDTAKLLSTDKNSGQSLNITYAGLHVPVAILLFP